MADMSNDEQGCGSPLELFHSIAAQGELVRDLEARNAAKVGHFARGEGERVLDLESREGTRASRGIEEGHSRSFWGWGGKASFPSTSAGDLILGGR